MDFIYMIKPCRSGFIDSVSSEEESIIDKHFDYLKKSLDSGRLILAGPCTDSAFGIVIFRADSREDAVQFMNNDPAVKNKVMTAELHEFHISLMEKYRD